MAAVPVLDVHLDVYVPDVRPVQLNTALFPDQLEYVHWFKVPLAYASMQSIGALTGQVIVNDWLLKGLEGLITGVPSPQLTHDGEATENDMA